MGVINFLENQRVFVGVGGKGGSTTKGYNGGGGAASGGRGGGATHIALVDGTLSSLSENVNDLLIVAGGGGGAFYGTGSNTGSYHGHGGGYEGIKGIETSGNSYAPGGKQQRGSSNSNFPRGNFGLGGTGTGYGGGGGGGYYGGNAGKNVSYSGGGGYTNWGGGGSGYLSEKLNEGEMWVYKGSPIGQVPENTMNVANSVSETPTEKVAKKGKGYARITLVE